MAKVLQAALRSDYPHLIRPRSCSSGSRRCWRWPMAGRSRPTTPPSWPGAPAAAHRFGGRRGHRARPPAGSRPGELGGCWTRCGAGSTCSPRRPAGLCRPARPAGDRLDPAVRGAQPGAGGAGRAAPPRRTTRAAPVRGRRWWTWRPARAGAAPRPPPRRCRRWPPPGRRRLARSRPHHAAGHRPGRAGPRPPAVPGRAPPRPARCTCRRHPASCRAGRHRLRAGGSPARRRRPTQHGFVLTRTLFRVPPPQGARAAPDAKLAPAPTARSTWPSATWWRRWTSW